ncbi:MAG: PBP1A family penicillin-binding protein [Alphaproteobacteria bacterium]|nr:PBP1A family penicillin-binding protein [Alphaproteobacteria bacterium]
MGLFRAKKRKRQSERIEPRLVTPRRERTVEPKSRPRRRRSLFGILGSFALTVSLWGGIGLALVFGYIWFTLSQNGVLTIPEREPGIRLLAADGSLISEQGAFHGDDVRLQDLPDYVPNALIAIEDHRFRSHFGVDPVGLIRAIYTNYRTGRLVQGGSTLTQQLAKNLFLSPDRTLQRKLQEVVLAVWLETQFTKDEILQLYLNRVYYGSGAVGIEKAAQTFYGKSAAELSLIEAATLAGVLKAPTTYNPANHPEAAAKRAKLVIDSMVEAGFISANVAQTAIDLPTTVKASDYIPATQYITDWVSEQLPDLVANYDQSIVIETTIDSGLQAIAERSLRRHLNEDGSKLKVSQGALVVLDGMGAVKALVGGKSYKRSQFNRVTKAKRQPGSAFKPFLYLAALEQGYSPDSVEIDEPVRIGDWEPENYRQKYLGAVTLQKALALSLNTVAAKLVVKVGPQSVVAVARRLGILSPLGTDASIALGTSEVTLLELTSAFVPFANSGYPVIPHVVTRISTRDGKVLYRRSGEGFTKAITDFDLGALNQMMRAVVTSGTAKRAQFGGYDIAGKTGTSQDYRDAWFIGYTADLIAGVWVGNDDNSPTQKVTGGSMPAAVWRDVMEAAHRGLSPRPLPGEKYEDGGLTSVSQIDISPDTSTVGDDQPSGFFDDIGSLFGASSSKPSTEKPTKKKGETAFERMSRARENR